MQSQAGSYGPNTPVDLITTVPTRYLCPLILVFQGHISWKKNTDMLQLCLSMQGNAAPPKSVYEVLKKFPNFPNLWKRRWADVLLIDSIY